MKLFDSHCHLDDKVFTKDMDAVFQRASEAGVSSVMIAGIDPARSERAVRLAESRPRVYASVGIHPHDARGGGDESLEFLNQLAASPKVRAWGEIGLDFNRMYSPREDQEKCFMAQLDMARQADLPIIFHERDSAGRFYDILEAYFREREARGVVHCFSGDNEALRRCLDLGLHVGITGILTHQKRGALLREQARSVPAERLLIETDAPYLTPAPQKNRTRRNEPAFVRSVFLKLAEVRGDAPDRLADVLWKNTRGLFEIKD
ncbi:MAG: TatD family hydrolase [Desulfobacterales bacterium]|nr:TatD family hydrolase [Desulfobacterales bacterium]